MRIYLHHDRALIAKLSEHRERLYLLVEQKAASTPAEPGGEPASSAPSPPEAHRG
jgi:hypothetical protein